MPQGLSKIKQIAAEAAARQKAYDEAGPGLRFFTLQDGQSARVRFLEQGDEVWYVWTHELPKKPGQRFGDAVMCLDQDDKGEPCPGCARGVTRGARVAINLIWYDAPKFQREAGKDGKPGKVVKDGAGNPVVLRNPDGSAQTEVVAATWNASQKVGGRLAHLNEKHGGLTGNVFDVMRQGTDKQTEYMIDFAAEQPPDTNDQQLWRDKPDPRKVLRQLSWRDMEQAYSGGVQAPNAPEAGMGTPSGEPNAFAQAASGAINRGAFG